MLKCQFKKVDEFPILSYPDAKKKCGRYHGSTFPGAEGYIVGVYIELGIDAVGLLHIQNGNEEGVKKVINECLEYFNQVPVGKKKTKKILTPPFGNLKLYKVLKIKDNVVEALIITDIPDCKRFWGEGIKKERQLERRGRRRK